MERYGRVGEEVSRSDPSLETGTQDSMWRLGLQGGGNESYPERSNEPDCIYYLRTGVCGYGSRCRFNHPRNRAPVLGGLTTESGEFPERMGQPVCQHFMRTGTCKFGASCKYHHPRQGGVGGDSITRISLNYMGFPLRPGEKECSYYMRTGQCKFGSTCRFHHPIPPSVQAQPSQQQQLPAGGPTIYSSLQSQPAPSSQQYGVVIPRPQLLPGTYVQSPYGYNQMVLPPGMVPYSGWNPYQVMPSPGTGTQPSMGSSSIYGITPSSSGFVNKEESFPQRSGEPECQYFMRTGDCKFGSSCRYHHPMDATITPSRISLPLRPGAEQCNHFAQHGICKFGPACRYDHSMGSISLSSSELKTITTGGTETVDASSSIASHPEPTRTKDGDSVSSVEAKTSR